MFMLCHKMNPFKPRVSKLLVFSFLYLVIVTIAQQEPSEYLKPGNSKTYLDAGNILSLEWSVSRDNDTIEFVVAGKTHGWIGIGIRAQRTVKMKGSDIVVGWISHGKVNFTDRHAVGQQKPIIDKEQNYDLLDAYENDTHTVFYYRRKLDTCDTHDLLIQKQGSLRLIYAYGPNDPEEGEDTIYHDTWRGSRSIFITPKSQDKVQSDNQGDIFEIDFTIDKFAVPSEKNAHFMCKIFKVPKLNGKHHIIKIKSKIENNNKDIVHSVIPYFCYGDALNGQESRQGECFGRNVSPEWKTCVEAAFFVHTGTSDFYFPDEVGMSLGGDGAPSYIKMVIQYDNLERSPGRVDSSGFSLVLTPSLRKFDSGLLLMQARDNNRLWRVPQNETGFRIFAHCPKECTEEGFPEGIHIFAVNLHMHLSGNSVILRHFRKGRELPIIASEQYFDSAVQDYVRLAQHVQIKPGDDLIAECSYDTTDKEVALKSGYTLKGEECAVIILFYPKVSFMRSQTHIDIPFTLKHMKNIAIEEHDNQYHRTLTRRYPITNAVMEQEYVTYDRILDMIDWTNLENVQRYQELQIWGPLRVTCRNNDTSTFVADKLILPTCVEGYHDEKFVKYCADKFTSQPAELCNGTNPLPGVKAMIEREENMVSTSGAAFLKNCILSEVLIYWLMIFIVFISF